MNLKSCSLLAWQDRYLPIANIARIMKNTLPGKPSHSLVTESCLWIQASSRLTSFIFFNRKCKDRQRFQGNRSGTCLFAFYVVASLCTQHLTFLSLTIIRMLIHISSCFFSSYRNAFPNSFPLLHRKRVISAYKKSARQSTVTTCCGPALHLDLTDTSSREFSFCLVCVGVLFPWRARSYTKNLLFTLLFAACLVWKFISPSIGKAYAPAAARRTNEWNKKHARGFLFLSLCGAKLRTRKDITQTIRSVWYRIDVTHRFHCQLHKAMDLLGRVLTITLAKREATCLSVSLVPVASLFTVTYFRT